VRALVRGEADAACLIDANHLLFSREARSPAGAARVPARTAPYDHCNFTVLRRQTRTAAGSRAAARDVVRDPEVRPLLDLEGLKEWAPRRTTATRARRARSIDSALERSSRGWRAVRLDRPGRIDSAISASTRGAPPGQARGSRRAAGRGSQVTGDASDRAATRTWCRAAGPRACARHRPPHARLARGSERAGAGPLDAAARVSRRGAPARRPSIRPDLGARARAARGRGGVARLRTSAGRRLEVWSDEARDCTRRRSAAQWDRPTADPWERAVELPDEVEDAVVQVMTYLIENETAALLVPSAFLARIHPHFRECCSSSPCRRPTRRATSRSSRAARL
jgi:hypothetical protein